jgi:hypothetical protein
MTDEILKTAASQGVWTLLSFMLILFIIKNQEKLDLRQSERENKYQEIISDLTDKLHVICELRDDFKEMKSYVHKSKEL